MQHVQRVPKGQRVRTAGGMHFAFDAHYAMSTLCHQTLWSCAMILRLAGPSCPQYDSNEGEDYACWHLALFSVARCTGPGRCCDPMLYKHLLVKGAPSCCRHAREKH